MESNAGCVVPVLNFPRWNRKKVEMVTSLETRRAADHTSAVRPGSRLTRTWWRTRGNVPLRLKQPAGVRGSIMRLHTISFLKQRGRRFCDVNTPSSMIVWEKRCRGRSHDHLLLHRFSCKKQQIFRFVNQQRKQFHSSPSPCFVVGDWTRNFF